MTTFYGSLDPGKAVKWINEMESNFEVLETPEDVKVTVAKTFLIEKAEKWWKSMVLALMANK